MLAFKTDIGLKLTEWPLSALLEGRTHSAEAVWKQADVVDFRRSGGGGHGGFHRGR